MYRYKNITCNIIFIIQVLKNTRIIHRIKYCKSFGVINPKVSLKRKQRAGKRRQNHDVIVIMCVICRRWRLVTNYIVWLHKEAHTKTTMGRQNRFVKALRSFRDFMFCSNKVKVIKIVHDPTQVGDPGLESPRNGHNIEAHINNNSNDAPMQSFLIPVCILVLFSTVL